MTLEQWQRQIPSCSKLSWPLCRAARARGSVIFFLRVVQYYCLIEGAFGRDFAALGAVEGVR